MDFTNLRPTAVIIVFMGRPFWSFVLREKEKKKREKERQLAILPVGERVESAWGSINTTGNGLWGTSDPRLWPSGQREDSSGGGRHVDNLWGVQSDSAWVGDNELDSSDAAMPPLEMPTMVERSALDGM